MARQPIQLEASTPERGAQARVAILDDDEEAAESIAAVLRIEGIDVQAYSNPHVVVAQALAGQVSALVVDWDLGNTTAEWIVRCLAERGALPHGFIWVLSGRASAGGSTDVPSLLALTSLYGIKCRCKPMSPRSLAEELRRVGWPPLVATTLEARRATAS
jgi:DNA-binding response OmpR family regulator